MDSNAFQEVWNDCVHFFERIFGWLTYVLGNADDPNEYDDTVKKFFERLKWF